MRNLVYSVSLVVMIAVFALPIMAQKNESCVFAQRAQAPVTTFQSTSAMPMSGSVYASQPMLDADGMATYEGAGRQGGGPRKAGAINGEDDGDLPIGDGMWFMVILAVGYAFFIAWRKKRVKSEE